MVSQITLTGMVLVSAPVSDYDKRLVILTKERGRVTVFVKGARRPNSQYMAGTRPFSFGRFTVYEGKNAYNLTGIDISRYFHEMSNDMDSLYYGMYFLELADYFGKENIESGDMLNLLYATFNAIIKGSISLNLIRMIYELRIFTINGEYPQVFKCSNCGSDDKLMYFSHSCEGAVCKECIAGTKDGIKISETSFYTLQFIISSDIRKLYTFNLSEDIMTECSRIITRWVKDHCDKEFKSLELING